MDSDIKEEIPVHEEFILCCGVETQVLKCGPWTDLINDQSANRPKLLILLLLVRALPRHMEVPRLGV
uniref:Uncharacterized protein n=1 Tax=Sus scrofa TaxID=9823 RepID=A0A4X1U0X7_PIG